MKKFFNDAEIKIVLFAIEDIIATSGENDSSFPGDDDVIEY